MEKFIKKIFGLHGSGQIVLQNQDETLALVSDRVERLKSIYGDKEKTSAYIEELFGEFVEIYEYDKKNAVLPEPFGIFENDDEKQAWIENKLLAQDLDIHIGAILYNYHDWLVDVGFPDIILGRFVVDYPALYERVLYDYIGTLKNIPPQYGFEIHNSNENLERRAVVNGMQRTPCYSSPKAYTATYILPSLIEHFLVGFAQQDLVDVKVKELFRRIDKGILSVSQEEKNFMLPFLTKSKYMSGDKVTSMKRCYEILKKYSLVDDKDGSSALIKGYSNKGNMTLGSFLNNGYVKKHMKSAYYSIMDIMFSTERLDIRNAIMHGASLTYDPFAMCVTAIMLQLFWQIMEKSVIEIN